MTQEELVEDKTQYTAYVKKFKKGCPMKDFIDKFDTNKLEYLIKIGDVFEKPAGVLRAV